jgi:integrase
MAASRKQRLPRHLYWRGGIIYGWYWQPDPSTPRGRRQIKQSTGCTDPDAALEVLRGWERDAADPAAAARRDATLSAKRAGVWTGDLDDLFPPGFESSYEPRSVFWTHQQATKVLAQLEDVPHRRAQVCFVLATGAEKRAVQKALRSDLTRVPLPLHGTKTRDRERVTPVLFAWQRSLLSYAKTHADGDEGLAFTEWRNSTRDLAVACKTADVPVVSMHGLRHVFGAWMLDEGLSEGIVAKALGHRDLRQLVFTYDTRDPAAIQRRAEEQMRRWHGLRGLRVIKGGKAAETAGASSRSKRSTGTAGRR